MIVQFSHDGIDWKDSCKVCDWSVSICLLLVKLVDFNFGPFIVSQIVGFGPSIVSQINLVC